MTLKGVQNHPQLVSWYQLRPTRSHETVLVSASSMTTARWLRPDRTFPCFVQVRTMSQSNRILSSKMEFFRKMLNLILAMLPIAGYVNSLDVHNQTLNSIEDVTEDITTLDDVTEDITTLDDVVTLDDMATQDDLAVLDWTSVKMIDDEDYDNLGGSGDMSDDQDEDNADDKEYPDELIDELAEDIIMVEEEDFVESLIKEYEDDQSVTVGRQLLKQDGAGGFLSSNLMAGILAASASFFITSVMAIFYVTFRVRRMKKELCEDAELCGFLDNTKSSTQVIWKGETKNSSNQWL